MASSERPPFRGTPRTAGVRSGAQEETLRTEKIHIERKTFVFTLKQNPRGRFLRITEDVGGRRDTIIVPAPGLDEFKRMLNEMVRTAAESPADQQP